jgi:hypothetical protein
MGDSVKVINMPLKHNSRISHHVENIGTGSGEMAGWPLY